MTKILIIEDEISFSEALSFLLEKEGYSTVVAETGKQGLDAFKSCLLYTSPSPRDRQKSRMPSSA